MQTENSTLNGVDRKKLTETVQLLSVQPHLAEFSFRLNNHWIEGRYSHSVINGFSGVGKEENSREVSFIPVSDAPELMLGKDRGPTPFEYVLHALAGCIASTVVNQATLRGYQINSIRTKVEGDIDLKGSLGIDPAALKGYREIRVGFEIDGDIPGDEKKEIMNMIGFSPVLEILLNPVPVKIELAVKESATEIDC